MTDPAPLTDDELRMTVGMVKAGGILTKRQVRRLVATVEQTRSQRDAAEAPSVELVQALLESENVVDRLTAERDAAYAVIRRLRSGWRSGERVAVVMAGSPRPPSEWIWMHNHTAVDSEPMSPAEVDAIRRARATTELTALGEPDIDHYRSDWRDVVRPPRAVPGAETGDGDD